MNSIRVYKIILAMLSMAVITLSAMLVNKPALGGEVSKGTKVMAQVAKEGKEPSPTNKPGPENEPDKPPQENTPETNAPEVKPEDGNQPHTGINFPVFIVILLLLSAIIIVSIKLYESGHQWQQQGKSTKTS